MSRHGDMHTEGYIFSEPLEELYFNEARRPFYRFRDVGSHVMRVEEYDTLHEAQMSALAAKMELDELSARYGIKYAEHQNIIGEAEYGGILLYQHTEHIKDGVSFDALCKSDVDIGENVLREIDNTTCALARHVTDVAHEGGVISEEFTRLGQFVVSPSMPEGHRMVLVDIEPMGPKVVARPEIRRQSGEDMISIVDAATVLIKSFLQIKSRAQYTFSSEEDLKRMVNSIQGDDEVFEQVRGDLSTALDTGDEKIVDTIFQTFEDEQETPDAYWGLYVSQHQLRYAYSFDSPEELRHYIGKS